MFDSIRSHRRWLMFFLLVLVFPSFVFFGIQWTNDFLGRGDTVAEVGGQPVSQGEFDAAMRQRVDQFRQMFGQNFDPKAFETPEARAAMLDGLLADRALALEAARQHVVVSENRLRELIGSIPAFQQDGKFDYQRYQTVLAAQGRSELAFEQAVRDDLARQTLQESVARSAMVPRVVLDRLHRLGEETRTVREQRFNAADFASRAKIDDAAIARYYEANKGAFQTPESARVEYVVLTQEAVATQIDVPEADLRAAYEQNQARFGEGEQRRASHILFSVGDGGSAKDKDGARKLAEQTLARVRTAPGDFAKLARELSKDPGSAANGGDLGFFGRGMMVKPFEDAAFGLKPGEISGVVESDFGFHVIRVTEVKAAQTKPFDEVRGQLLAELRRERATKRFAELSEQFSNLVYEQADSLKPAADKLKLEVRTVEALTRAGLPARPGEPQLFGPRVTQAVFADEAIRDKRNTEAIEAAPGVLVAARVAEHRPAKQQPLDAVKDSVRERLQRDEALRLARAAAAEKLTAVQKAPDPTGWSAPRKVSRNAPEGLTPTALNAVMRAPADKLPAYVTADVDNGAVLFEVQSASLPQQQNEQRRSAEQRGLEQVLGAGDEQAYLDSLKAKHKATVLRPELKTGAAAAAPAK